MDGVQETCEEATRFHDNIYVVNIKIRWQGEVNNITILNRAGLPPMEDLLIRNNLRWTVHLLRMPRFSTHSYQKNNNHVAAPVFDTKTQSREI